MLQLLLKTYARSSTTIPHLKSNNFNLHSEWEICSISAESNFLDDLGESSAPNLLAFQDPVYRVMAHACIAFRPSDSKSENVFLGYCGPSSKRPGCVGRPDGAYLKAAGIGVRPPGAWGRRPPAKPANEKEVTTGSDAAKRTHTINSNPENLY
jgi:hypothetical protein